MTLGENLQYIRAKFGLTQEQLAEKLDVSRQSVSKWEAGSSFPEMEKILQICELYGVSMDDLTRGDVRKGYAVDEARYDRHMNRFSRTISIAVGIILLGVTTFVFIRSRVVEDRISVLVMMLFILVAVPVLIVTGIRHGNFCRKHPYIENFYSQAEIDSFNHKFPILIAAPVTLIIAGVILFIAMDGVSVPSAFDDGIFAAVFMLCITVAVPVMVYAGIQKSKYDLEEYNRENFRPDLDLPEEIRQRDMGARRALMGRTSGVIMLAATMIFLMLGFTQGLWYIAWVAFPIGGMACGIAALLLNVKD